MQLLKNGFIYPGKLIIIMKKSKALAAAALLSLAGILFSGYLSYSEVLGGTCAAGGCSSLLGLPTCIYGFVLYLLIFLVSLRGAMAKE